MNQEKHQWKVVMALLIAIALMTFSNALIVLTLSLNTLREPEKLTTNIAQSTNFEPLHSAASDTTNSKIRLSDPSELVPTALDTIGDFSNQLKKAMEQTQNIAENGAGNFVSDKIQTLAIIENWIVQLKYWRDSLAVTCGIPQSYEFEGECSQVMKPDGTPSTLFEEICLGTQASEGQYCPYPDPYDSEMTDLMDDFIDELELIKDAIAGIQVDSATCVTQEDVANKYSAAIGNCYSESDDFSQVTDKLLEELNKNKDAYLIRLAAIQVSSAITYLEKVEQVITSVDTLVNNPLELLRPILGDKVVDGLIQLIGGVGATDIMNWVETSVDARISALENDTNELLAQLEPITLCKFNRKTGEKVCTETPVSDEIRAQIESQIQTIEEKIAHYNTVKVNLDKATYVLIQRVTQNFEEGEAKLEMVKNALKGYGVDGEYTDQDAKTYLTGLQSALQIVTPTIAEALKNMKKGMEYLYDGTEEDISNVDCENTVVSKESAKSFEGAMNVREVCGDFIAYSDAVLKGFETAKTTWDDENIWAWQTGVLQNYNNLVINFANLVYDALGKMEAIGDEIAGKMISAFETFVEVLENIANAFEEGVNNFGENVVNPFLEKTANVLDCVEEVAQAWKTCKETPSSCPDVTTLCTELRN